MDSGLPRQAIAEIQVPGTRPGGGHSTAGHNFRPDFIAVATNPNATVHYDFRRGDPPSRLQQGQALSENPSTGSPPPGMQQGNGPMGRGHEVDRDAIRHRHREQQARPGGRVAVDPLEDLPARGAVMPLHPGPVYLLGQYRSPKSGEGPSKGPPAAHHLAHRSRGPETQIEVTAGSVAPGGDAGQNTVTRPPVRDLEARHRPGERRFTDRQSSSRSISAPSARSRASICS